MKTISKLALAALLSTSVGLAAAPATAKDKKEDAKAPGMKLSPDVLKPAQAAQAALTANDIATAEPQIAAAEAAAKTDDDRYVAASLRLNVEQMKVTAARTANPNAPVNQTGLAAPLDVLIANPRTAPADKAKYNFVRGQLSYQGKAYPQAVQFFTAAQQGGYQDPQLPLQIAQAKVLGGDTAGGLADLSKVIDAADASGTKAPEDYYKFGLSRAMNAKDKAATMTWLTKWVTAYPTAKNRRDAIVIYGLQQNAIATLDKPQKLDLFRLLRVSNALADQGDYEEYAQYAFDKGLPAESVSVLKEGIASGKLQQSNRNVSDMLAEANKSANAEGSLAPLEARARTAADAKLATGTADAYFSQSNWAKAADLYRVALGKPGVNADEVNTHLGMALARSGDKAGAAAAFAAVKTEPRMGIAALWNAWVGQPAA